MLGNSPMEPMDVMDGRIWSRKVASYEKEDEGFMIKERRFGQQYGHLYHVRLTLLKEQVRKEAEKRWLDKSAMYVKKILDVRPDQLCYVIGTVYLNMPLKPCILDEISQERYIIPPPHRDKYISEEDEIILEDEYGRLKLSGICLKKEVVVTGIVMGILGKERINGDFEVEDYCFAGMPPRHEVEKSMENGQESKAGDDKYVALISGLNMGQENVHGMSLQMLMDYFNGHLGDGEENEFITKICRVIIAGNIVKDTTMLKDVMTNRKTTNESTTKSAELIREMDTFLSQLACTLPVDVMSGDHDPTTYFLPQQPMLKSLFPISNQFDSFSCVSNPHACRIDDISFIGTAGQNIHDIFKFVQTHDHLLIMEKTLQWRHIAPTAPDTLPCYPYATLDPFILKTLPHVYFAGNHSTFETKMVHNPQGQSTRLILVPSFSETRTIILLNLNTLDCFPLVISPWQEKC